MGVRLRAVAVRRRANYHDFCKALQSIALIFFQGLPCCYIAHNPFRAGSDPGKDMPDFP
jgi:hypothetical protein